MKIDELRASGIAVFAMLAEISTAWAQVHLGNLVKNPGFEDPLPPKLANAFISWAFVNHNQDFIRGEVGAQDYHSGLKAAAISVGGSPRVYACWCQHVATDDPLPDQVSLWYRAPENDAAIVLGFIGAVSGLSHRWTAFCQSVGADKADAKTRLLAVEAGTGYAVLRAEDEGRNIFLRHALLGRPAGGRAQRHAVSRLEGLGGGDPQPDGRRADGHRA